MGSSSLVQAQKPPEPLSLAVPLCPAAKLGVQCLAQPVADQVEPEHRNDDRGAGEDCEVNSGLEVAHVVGHHSAPLSRRRVRRTQTYKTKIVNAAQPRLHRVLTTDDTRPALR